jgi:hypothetical protein
MVWPVSAIPAGVKTLGFAAFFGTTEELAEKVRMESEFGQKRISRG